MKWAFMLSGCGFILFSLFIAPFLQYRRAQDASMLKEAENKLLKARVAKGGERIEELRDRLSDARAEAAKVAADKQQPIALAHATNILNRTAEQMADWLRKQERLLAESGRGGDEFLKEIVKRPAIIPHIDPSEKIDLVATEEVRASIDDVLSKQAAKEALARREGASNSAAALKIAAPLADYYVARFEDALRELAKANDDLVTSTYTSAFEFGQKPEGQDFGIVKMEKHGGWTFQVYFRSTGNGNYNWEVQGSAASFLATFRGEEFACGVTGTQVGWRGSVASLGRTNLMPAFTWLIGVHKAKYPLIR